MRMSKMQDIVNRIIVRFGTPKLVGAALVLGLILGAIVF